MEQPGAAPVSEQPRCDADLAPSVAGLLSSAESGAGRRMSKHHPAQPSRPSAKTTILTTVFADFQGILR